jgi:hypothetical protein
MRPIQRAPRVGFSAFPTEALFEFPAIREVGDTIRGEYITASSERKRVLESIFLAVEAIPRNEALNLFLAASQTRIDEIFCFE